jgi:hypothetical protein
VLQDSELLLKPRQAYFAMFEFLRQHYLRGMSESEEIAGMLSGLTLLADGQPADAAYASDWSAAVSTVMMAEESPAGYRQADFRPAPAPSPPPLPAET